MRKQFFDTTSTYEFAKRAAAKLPEALRYTFSGLLGRAYMQKQNSKEDNLSSYRLTKQDVQSIFAGV